MMTQKRSLDMIFRPQSVAVVGASNKPGNIGREIVHNLIEFEFQGPVFPVNPRLRTLHSLKVYPDIESIPDPIDLAVIVVPKEAVVDVAEACGRRGVGGLVVISAGFKEVGGAGVERERRLKDVLDRYGMRMVGPNCMGVLNTEPAFRLNASFARTIPIPGNIGFMSQSGALGEAILAIAARKGIGFSMFVSVGNKTDVGGNDLLQYWEHDAATDLVLLYLENFGNPRLFTEIARRITRRKPILAVKAGRTSAGARAVSSHTGVLAGQDMATDLLFEQCGVIRVASVEELFDLAPAFALQPPPAGPRVGIITNAGGPGILATDACVRLGLVVEPPSPETKARLRAELPPDASVENPIDLLASATPDLYRLAVREGLHDPALDALIVIFVPPVMTRSDEVARAIHEECRGATKPVLVCFMGADEGVPGVAELRAARLPVYTFPESAANALAALETYRRWRDRPEGRIVKFEVDRAAAEAHMARATAAGREWLTGAEARGVLEAYGIAQASAVVVTDEADLPAALARTGLPAVLKRDSGGEHKSEADGLRLNLKTAEAVQRAFRELRGGPNQPLVLMEMVTGARELILGMSVDPVSGPLLMVGAGGTYVEIFQDVAFRIHPVTDDEAAEMLRSLKSYPLLTGFRGESAIDIAGVEEVVLRLSQLIGDFPRIIELDLNPFMALPAASGPGQRGSRGVDVRVRLSPAGA